LLLLVKWITLGFGQPSPWEILHSGIDIAGKLDQPVVPIYEGVVVYGGKTVKGYGRHIIIDHGDNVKSIYAHLNKVFVYSGQRVTSSDVIGGQGKSGWATGVHLHLQINVYSLPVNPRVFLGLDN
jgi:murein DD-endopeptidase MepM/ murein hydrolase activator NlpD